MNGAPPVVSNAGPLMVLAKLNLLHLLKELYGRVHFAQSVYDETVTEGIRQGYEDANTLSRFLDQANWSPQDVSVDPSQVDLVETRLDRGERDTLILAEILGSRLVLIDETMGRQIARARGFQVRGSLGLLIEAHRRSLLGADQLRLSLTEIARRQDIWINPALVERLLGEILAD